MEKKIKIPNNSILGLNYSGMHDSSIAIVSSEGEVIYALSLERVSRKKQDGRFPEILLNRIPMDKISKIAISNNKSYNIPKNMKSLVHPTPLKKEIIVDRSHKDEYYKQINRIEKDKEFYAHHKCHVSSAFWASGFDEALCLVYDGGMANEYCFGGLYKASKENGIEDIDLFSSQSYANITHLYTYITTLLGFTPLKHEGKITGLAAYGKVTKETKELLLSWLENPQTLEQIYSWENMYGQKESPYIKIDYTMLKKVQKQIAHISHEDLAATVQNIAEEHVLNILSNLKKSNSISKNICLSGGLFANVKINQRVSEFGFENIFISPPMSDDGTALGAAWLALYKEKNIKDIPFKHVYLGDNDSIGSITKYKNKIVYKKYDDPTSFIATKLSQGAIFAIFQDRCEYGPRSLGNRSIIAQATKYEVNEGLNNRLNRTEFMPFAPVIRKKDAHKYFHFKQGELFTAKFMTITLNCTPKAKTDCPAVVHIDNTARPQIIEDTDNPLMYDILTQYSNLTDKYALVNTSFNIHEEPIVNSYEDALKGFFESGLDYLYLDGIIISLEDNYKVHAQYLKEKLQKESSKLKSISKQRDEVISQNNKNKKELNKYDKENKALLTKCKNFENSKLYKIIQYLKKFKGK